MRTILPRLCLLLSMCLLSQWASAHSPLLNTQPSLASDASLPASNAVNDKARSSNTKEGAITHISLAAEDSWPPFANQFGQGLSHQLIQAAFAKAEIEVDSIVVPYTRALMMAEKGDVDGAFNVTRQHSTENRFVFGTKPLFTAYASFYHKHTRPLNADSKWELPPKTRIGLIQGYEYGDELDTLIQEKQFEVMRVASQNQLINLLLIDRIDTAIMFDIVANDYLNAMGVEKEVEAAFHNHSSDIYLAFSKVRPNAVALATLLDRGLNAIQASGEYQALMAKAMPVKPPMTATSHAQTGSENAR